MANLNSTITIHLDEPDRALLERLTLAIEASTASADASLEPPEPVGNGAINPVDLDDDDGEISKYDETSPEWALSEIADYMGLNAPDNWVAVLHAVKTQFAELRGKLERAEATVATLSQRFERTVSDAGATMVGYGVKE